MAVERCPSAGQENCPYYDREGCFSSTHHRFWPANLYKTILETTFRELDANKQQVCRYEHDQIHEQAPPAMPTPVEMLNAIREAHHGNKQR